MTISLFVSGETRNLSMLTDYELETLFLSLKILLEKTTNVNIEYLLGARLHGVYKLWKERLVFC